MGGKQSLVVVIKSCRPGGYDACFYSQHRKAEAGGSL